MEEVALDSNVLIDLMDLGCIESLGRLAKFRFWVLENVQGEIIREDQRILLDRLVIAGVLRATAVGAGQGCALEELATYARLKEVLGDGEAASLAVAHHRGWICVSYEKGRLRREARALLGNRFQHTPWLLAEALRAGVKRVSDWEEAMARCASPDRAEHLSRLVEEARRGCGNPG